MTSITDPNCVQGIDDKAFFPIIADKQGEGDAALRMAYANVYADIDDKTNDKIKGAKPSPADRTKFLSQYKPTVNSASEAAPAAEAGKTPNPFQQLIAEQGKWTEASLDRNKAVARSASDADMKTARTWLTNKIGMLTRDIEALENQLGGDAGKVIPMQVIDEKGVTITDEARVADPGMRRQFVW